MGTCLWKVGTAAFEDMRLIPCHTPLAPPPLLPFEVARSGITDTQAGEADALHPPPPP